MPYIAYETKKFRDDSLLVILQAEEICAEYAAQGYDLTLRQLYYQFVARGLIENSQKSYKRLGSIINDARLSGKIDWNYITDRTRNLEGNNHWDSPADVIRAAAQSYRNALWDDQPVRIEVWVEKEALAGVIEQATRPLDVDYFSCRGYVSQSEMWSAGQRFYELIRDRNQRVLVLHLGDHDPSGIDMTRDIEDRLRLFVGGHLKSDGLIETVRDYEALVEVRRIALTRNQIDQYQPPPNPAKLSDSRARDYVIQHGYESWELDALDPTTLGDLIRLHVERERDEDLWDAALARQEEGREALFELARNWRD